MKKGSRVVINDKTDDIIFGKIGYIESMVKHSQDPLWKVRLNRPFMREQIFVTHINVPESKLLEIMAKPKHQSSFWDSVLE